MINEYCLLFYMFTKTMFQIFGLGLMAVGIWLNADKNLHAYLAVLVRSAEETAVTGTTVLLIVSGILLVAMAILCFYALSKGNSTLLLVVIKTLRLVACGIIINF